MTDPGRDSNNVDTYYGPARVPTGSVCPLSRIREWIMASKKDYYEILGVDRNADEKKLKAAYRKLARKYHPDVNKGSSSAEARFKEISEAFAVLSDAEKRAKYDRGGHEAFGAGFDPFAGFDSSRAGVGDFWTCSTSSDWADEHVRRDVARSAARHCDARCGSPSWKQ